MTINPTEPTTAGYGEPVTVTVQIPFSQRELASVADGSSARTTQSDGQHGHAARDRPVTRRCREPMRPKSLALLLLALGCGLVASIGITEVMARRNAEPGGVAGETQSHLRGHDRHRAGRLR